MKSWPFDKFLDPHCILNVHPLDFSCVNQWLLHLVFCFSVTSRLRYEEPNFRQKEKEILDRVLGSEGYDRRIRPAGMQNDTSKFLEWQPCHFPVMVFWLFWAIYLGFSKCFLIPCFNLKVIFIGNGLALCFNKFNIKGSLIATYH